MLTRLYIDNYALIDHLDIAFAPGLTIITGETGAGKSIVMGALSLILGDRADVKAIHDGTRKTVVEATLNIKGYDLKQVLENADVDYDEQECILRREVAPTGRSRAFVNDTPVSLAFLRDMATRLVDIHSQHSNMLLAKPQFQLDILDCLANNSALRAEYAAAYRNFKDAERKLEELTQRLNRARGEEDYMRFQLNQLQAMNLQPGEDEQLEQDQARLSNITEIKQALLEVDHLLNDEQVSVINHLKTITTRLQAVEDFVPQLQGMTDRAQSSLIELKDMAESIGDAQESLQLDPEQLQRIDERLNDIFNLERKHQVQTVDELLSIQHDYEQKLMQLDTSDEQVQQLTQQVQQLQSQATELATRLSQTRHEAANSFGTLLVQRAKTLALKNLQFDIDFQQTSLAPSGADAVEFRMAFNKNQPLMPVKDTASGGEISRVMLCIKAIIAQRINLPTLIFDEVDTGVSGDTASMMGEMMGDIARNIQVIAITHLPQVASHGDNHLKVYKTDEEDRTITHVSELNDQQHIMEVARMLSGKDLNEAAIENAKTLINQNKK